MITRMQESAARMRGLRELRERILGLREQLNAVILAHNYQRPEVQEVADFTGDSLELAQKCVGSTAEVIVFCGVRFMAETAAIINPTATVLLSESSAGCPLAEMITPERLREWRRIHPFAAVVAYVNTTAATKAESDFCCTSANGVRVVDAVPSDEILFVPDRNLGHYISTKTRKRLILHDGFCHVHDQITGEEVEAARRKHPKARVLVHPECRPEVVSLADEALSTSQMLRYAGESTARSFVIGTEGGLLYALRQQNPEKEFHLLSQKLLCPDMKRTTLESVVHTMETRANVIEVPEDIQVKARRSIERMLELG